MVMYYLVFPDGSKLFQSAYPEDFVYHCLCLAIDKDLGLRPVKVLDTRGLYFFRLASFVQEASPSFPVCLFRLRSRSDPGPSRVALLAGRVETETPSGITGSHSSFSA